MFFLDFDEGDAVPHFDGASEQAPGVKPGHRLTWGFSQHVMGIQCDGGSLSGKKPSFNGILWDLMAFEFDLNQMISGYYPMALFCFRISPAENGGF